MKPSAKAITIYNKKLLLILRDNFAHIADPNKWNLPGGEVDEGETYEEAIMREFYEELCIKPKNVKRIGILEHSDGSKHALFYIQLDNDECKSLKLGNEGQELRFFKYDELKDIELTYNLTKYLALYGDYLKLILEENIDILAERLGLQALDDENAS